MTMSGSSLSLNVDPSAQSTHLVTVPGLISEGHSMFNPVPRLQRRQSLQRMNLPLLSLTVYWSYRHNGRELAKFLRPSRLIRTCLCKIQWMFVY